MRCLIINKYPPINHRDKFGRLTVLNRFKKNGTYYWECSCDCGNKKDIQEQHLKSGASQSCGCLRKELTSKRCFENLLNKKFGRLTVIKRVEDKINKQGKPLVQYLCNCDCGNDCIVLAASLKSGLTTSCGCFQKEKAVENGKKCIKRNEYDLSGDFGVGKASNTDNYFYFDLEDYEKIKDYCWEENNKHYITNTSNKDKRFLMHNLIMNSKEIDHINHNTLDNRKQNLRIVTRSQNQMNARLRSNNKSGVTGVWWDNTHCCWVAAINKNHIRHILGTFNDFDKAVKARKGAEEKYFGKYSYDESMKNIQF